MADASLTRRINGALAGAIALSLAASAAVAAIKLVNERGVDVPAGWITYRDASRSIVFSHPRAWKVSDSETVQPEIFIGTPRGRLDVAVGRGFPPPFDLQLELLPSSFDRALAEGGGTVGGRINGRRYMTLGPSGVLLDWGTLGTMSARYQPDGFLSFSRYWETAARIVRTVEKLPDPAVGWKEVTGSSFRVKVPPGWHSSLAGSQLRLKPSRSSVLVTLEERTGRFDADFACGSDNFCVGASSGSILLDHSAQYLEFRRDQNHRVELRIDWTAPGTSKPRTLVLMVEAATDSDWEHSLRFATLIIRSVRAAA